MAGFGSGQWQNPFYDPSSAYGGTVWGPGQFAQTGLGNYYFGEQPEAAWTRYAGELGLDPFSAQGQFARSLYPQVYEGFLAASGTNPNLTIQNYVRGIDIQGLFNNQTARQRGENPGSFAPRASTIARAY